ncbi:hypothetical protein V7068_14475 [Bacillus sp. JJ634]
MDEILNCYQLEDLHVKKQYKVVVMNHLMEMIPVFKMDQVWENIKKALCPGGLIVMKTKIYETPNELGDDETNYAQIRCNKQTVGTLLKSFLKLNLIMAESTDEFFVLIRKEDLSFYSQEQKNRFLTHHQKWASKYNLEQKEFYSEEDFRHLVPGAGRMMIGCVAENNHKYQTQALRLIQSIRWFGGKMAGANIFVCMVDEADPEFVKELEKWGVFVRIVSRFSVTHPPSNKLRLFELPEVDSYDTIMLLDCDTVIVQDPYPLIDGEHFQAEIAAAATIPNHIFSKLFAHYHLPMPKQTYMTSLSREKTIWYCNAGVLIFPIKVLRNIYPVWKQYTIDLSQKKSLLGKHYFFCEQASLSIALAAQAIPFRRLPLSMNFHLTSIKKYHMKHCDPVIIHYHKMNDETGFLKNCSFYPLSMCRVNQFNDRLRKHLFTDKKL